MLAVSTQATPEIEIYQVETDNAIELWGRNTNIYPVTVNLKIDKTNLSSNRTFPIYEVLDARSDKKIVELEVISNREAWEYKTDFSFFMGGCILQNLMKILLTDYPIDLVQLIK